MNKRLPHLLRPLLALLTVVASFMFQVRVDALGGLSAGRSVSAAQLQEMLTEGSHCTENRAASAPAHAGHHSSPLKPETPDPHGGHGAHCPFCLTNAFALEAGIVGLPQGPPQFLPQPALSAVFRVVAAVRHADARAPPFWV